ncbi:MAG: hypothetical protein JW837_16165 [Sedimentisphaerales bacterium]|nr:hypothetical protein [Sedimentisphaerales bacterium]
MSTKTNIITHHSVIAITQEENRLKAIELRRQNGITNILWTKSSQDSMVDMGNFAATCGLSINPVLQRSPESCRAVVVGFNSAGVAFYRISVPSVGDHEIASMVRLQTETRLPLPAEQMEIAWRTDQMRNGQVGCIVAAARKKPLENFVENVRNFEPTKILLDCEGVIKAWRSFFGGTEKTAMVVSMSARNTQVCLAEKGRLCNAMILDIGMEDFTAEDEAEKMQTSERFIQDMISVLELFGYSNQPELPLFLLSDGNSVHMNIVYSLNSAGLDAQIALPDIKELRTSIETGIQEIYEYRVPIGLGLMAFETSKTELNIFEHLYKPTTKKEKKHWLYSPIITGIIAAAILVLWLFVFVILDIAKPGRINNSIKTTNADINSLIQRQNMIKSVAQQRPDLLELLAQVNASGENGIKLESFHYKKGQPVTISGEASGNEQLYKFEKSLQDSKNINSVKMSPSKDAKSKKIKFTITFHYKNFTK